MAQGTEGPGDGWRGTCNTLGEYSHNTLRHLDCTLQGFLMTARPGLVLRNLRSRN